MNQREQIEKELLKQKLKEELYEVKFRCLNCSFEGTLSIRKGKLVRKAPCPNCGVPPYRVEE